MCDGVGYQLVSIDVCFFIDGLVIFVCVCVVSSDGVVSAEGSFEVYAVYSWYLCFFSEEILYCVCAQV